MASIIDICNLSLANIGDSADVVSISPPDGTSQAAYCAKFYPIARDIVLEGHSWSFATTRILLADLGTPPAGWGYRYKMPANVLTAIEVYGELSDAPEPFKVESDSDGVVILTDVRNAQLRFTFKEEDSTVYSGLFIQALSWLLSSFLAGVITSDMQLKESAYKAYLSFMSEAAVADSGHLKTRVSQKLANFSGKQVGARS